MFCSPYFLQEGRIVNSQNGSILNINTMMKKCQLFALIKLNLAEFKKKIETWTEWFQIALNGKSQKFSILAYCFQLACRQKF